jgi:quinone-modifying oxidoreductase subunit QmoA
VSKVCGKEGAFSVEITLAPRLINNQCTSCGLCAEVCPEGAVYLPKGLSFPMKYCIHPDACKGESCGKCLEVCAYGAIHLDAREAEIQLQASRVILATGWKLYDPALIGNYHYQELPDVVTNLELEHMLAAATEDHLELRRPSDGKVPRKVALVQCAGSRDLKHLPYCSAVCCSASVKHALTLTERMKEVHTEIFYIDLRLSGRNEKLLTRIEGHDRIRLTKGKVGLITMGQEGPVLEVEDMEKGIKRKEEFDLVVLAMGLVPNQVLGKLGWNKAGFFLEEQEPGILAAGSCKRPMDVSASVKDATAAALKAMKI